MAKVGRTVRGPCAPRQPPPASPLPRNRAQLSCGDAAASSSAALGERLEFADIFVPEREQAVVHLAQGVEKHRDVDVLVLVLIFQRLEPAVKKRVFYAIDQIGDNTFQPERKPFLALVGKSIVESQDFPDLVDLAFPKIFINEAISDAVDRLCIDAHDLLANMPIAHLIPHAAADILS